MLNGLCHCLSNSQVLEHDTALAQLQLIHEQNFIPPGIKPGVHTILVWDNNYCGKETLSGKGTTHNTNGIIMQRQSTTGCEYKSAPDTSKVHIVHRSKKISTDAPPTDILAYHGG